MKDYIKRSVKREKDTCEECVYSSPARPPYRETGFIRCNEKVSEFGRSTDIVYVNKSSVCNIFKRPK